MPDTIQLEIACACGSVCGAVPGDLLLAAAEGNAEQKDVMNLFGLGACKEGCFATGCALPVLKGGSAQVCHLVLVSAPIVL